MRQPNATTGVSAGVTPKCSRTLATAGSSSMSVKREEETVARQEIADPERVLRVPGTDDAQSREVAGVAEHLPARDQRRQDHVPHVRRDVQELAQIALREGPGLGVAARDGGGERPRAGQPADLARELAVVMHDEGLRLVAGFVEDLDGSGLDDEEGHVGVAGLEDPFPVPEAPDVELRALRDVREVRLGERRKGDGGELRRGLGHAPILWLGEEGEDRLESEAFGPAPSRSRWTWCVAPGITTTETRGACVSSARSRSRSAGRDQKSRSEASTSVGARTSEASQSERPVAR